MTAKKLKKDPSEYQRPKAMPESLVSDSDLFQLILLGNSDKQIASTFQSGIKPQDIKTFRLAHGSELLELRREQFEQGRLLLENAVEIAVYTLIDIMNNSAAPQAARVAAAKTVLEYGPMAPDTQLAHNPTAQMEPLPNLLVMPDKNSDENKE